MKWRALLVHFFTAAGAFAGLLALERAIAGAYPAMFGWLALALLIDGIDGTLARRVKHVAASCPMSTATCLTRSSTI